MTTEAGLPRVVFTDPTWALDESGRPSLARADVERQVLGPGVRLELGVLDGTFVTAGPRFLDHVRDAHALVINRCEVTPELVEVIAPTCRIVVRGGVGVDNLRMPLLEAAGIEAVNIPDYCGDEVSTHALALLLALERGVCVQDRAVRADAWDVHHGGTPRRTASRSVGIVGFGRIGRATSRKLQAFYSRVYAFDPYVHPDVMASHGVQAAESLADLLARVDAVLLHAELTDETRGMIDDEALAAARPGTLLVNVARGGLVDLPAVLRALEAGLLGGYAADVFSPEDPNADPIGRRLLAREDVVVTAHRGFLSAESEASVRRRVAEAVLDALGPLAAPAAPEARVLARSAL
jgi:D-3-phosphoglycerate dehydrogenase